MGSNPTSSAINPHRGVYHEIPMQFALRRLANAVFSGLVALPVAQISGASFNTGLVIFVAISSLSFATNSPVNAVIAILMSIVSVAAVIRIYAQFEPNYSVNSKILVFLFLLALVPNSVAIRVWVNSKINHLETIVVAVFSAILFFANSSLLIDSKQSLVQIFAFGGEDSAAWLYQMSAGFGKSGDYFLSPLVSLSSGIFGGVFMTLTKTLFNLTNDEFLGVYGTPQTLQSAYILIAFLNGLISLKIVRGLMRNLDRSLKIVGMFFSATLSFLFSFALIRSGHLSALLIVLLVIATIAVLANQTDDDVSYLRALFLAQLLFAMAETWFIFGLVPLILLLLVTGSWFIRISKGFRFENLRWITRNPLKVLLLSAFASLFGVTIRPLMINVFDIENAKRLYALGGGTYSVIPLLGVLVFGLVAKYLIDQSFITETKFSAEKILYLFILSVLIVTFSVYLFSYFVPPYIPQYGPLKLMSISFIALIPIAVAKFFNLFSKTRDSLASGLLITLLFALPFLVIGQPFNYGEVVLKEQEIISAGWQSTLMDEIARDPGRTVVCLDTGTGEFEYISYLCTRTARGVQGLNDNQSGLWQHGSLCAPSGIFDFEFAEWGWSEDFFSNLTVLVSSPKALTNGVNCQASGWKNTDNADPRYTHGWLTFVRWDLVRVVSMDNGQLVDTSTLAW